MLHEKSDNEGDTDSSEDGNLYDSNYISENMAGLLHLVFVQTFFFTNNVFAYPRLESEHFGNVQDRVQWARLPRHDNAFQRVLVLSNFFCLLKICFCLPHRRLRTPGLRNRQQCAYQSLSILHFRLSNVSYLFNHSFTYRSPLLGDVNVGYANVCLSVKHVTYNTIPPGIGKLIKRVLYFYLGRLTCA